MLYLIAIIGGLIFLGMAILVGVNKNISIIPAIDDAKLKLIKKKDKVATDFGAHYLFISLACFFTAVISYFAAKVGMYIGLGVIVIATLFYSSLSNSINDKINRNIY